MHHIHFKLRFKVGLIITLILLIISAAHANRYGMDDKYLGVGSQVYPGDTSANKDLLKDSADEKIPWSGVYCTENYSVVPWSYLFPNTFNKAKFDSLLSMENLASCSFMIYFYQLQIAINYLEFCSVMTPINLINATGMSVDKNYWANIASNNLDKMLEDFYELQEESMTLSDMNNFIKQEHAKLITNMSKDQKDQLNFVLEHINYIANAPFGYLCFIMDGDNILIPTMENEYQDSMSLGKGEPTGYVTWTKKNFSWPNLFNPESEVNNKYIRYKPLLTKDIDGNLTFILLMNLSQYYADKNISIGLDTTRALFQPYEMAGGDSVFNNLSADSIKNKLYTLKNYQKYIQNSEVTNFINRGIEFGVLNDTLGIKDPNNIFKYDEQLGFTYTRLFYDETEFNKIVSIQAIVNAWKNEYIYLRYIDKNDKDGNSKIFSTDVRFVPLNYDILNTTGYGGITLYTGIAMFPQNHLNDLLEQTSNMATTIAQKPKQ